MNNLKINGEYERFTYFDENYKSLKEEGFIINYQEFKKFIKNRENKVLDNLNSYFKSDAKSIDDFFYKWVFNTYGNANIKYNNFGNTENERINSMMKEFERLQKDRKHKFYFVRNGDNILFRDGINSVGIIKLDNSVTTYDYLHSVV